MRGEDAMRQAFNDLVESLPQVGLAWHAGTILANSRANAVHIKHTIREIEPDPRPCLIVSAGPSLYRRQIIRRVRLSAFRGSIVATDGAFVQCLRHSLNPDYVVTLDPHPTRMVRWFGDPDLDANLNGDDYFNRQDLDVSFRTNSEKVNEENIVLVDRARSKLIICSTAPANVVKRTAHMERYWFAPLVDDVEADGLTRQIVGATALPAMNTGGTVGTAAWVFAHSVLKSPNIAVVGMDFGYPLETPLDKTQSWHMLGGDPAMYPQEQGHWGAAFTDPTYFYYRSNLLDLLAANGATLTNCSEAGLLKGENVRCMGLDEWLKSF